MPVAASDTHTFVVVTPPTVADPFVALLPPPPPPADAFIVTVSGSVPPAVRVPLVDALAYPVFDAERPTAPAGTLFHPSPSFPTWFCIEPPGYVSVYVTPCRPLPAPSLKCKITVPVPPLPPPPPPVAVIVTGKVVTPPATIVLAAEFVV